MGLTKHKLTGGGSSGWERSRPIGKNRFRSEGRVAGRKDTNGTTKDWRESPPEEGTSVRYNRRFGHGGSEAKVRVRDVPRFVCHPGVLHRDLDTGLSGLKVKVEMVVD